MTLTRRLRRPIAVGVTLLALGVGTWLALSQYVSWHVSHGTAVPAVVEVAGSQRLVGDYLMVSYEVGGDSFERRLRSTFTSYSPYEVGQQPSLTGQVARRVSTVISLGANTRSGGPQKPVPRVV